MEANFNDIDYEGVVVRYYAQRFGFPYIDFQDSAFGLLYLSVDLRLQVLECVEKQTNFIYIINIL